MLQPIAIIYLYIHVQAVIRALKRGFGHNYQPGIYRIISKKDISWNKISQKVRFIWTPEPPEDGCMVKFIYPANVDFTWMYIMLNNVQLNSSNIHKEHVLRCTIHKHYRVICCSSMITTTVYKTDKYINTTCYNVALVEAIYFDVHVTHVCKCPYNIIQIVAGTQYTIHIYNMVNCEIYNTR